MVSHDSAVKLLGAKTTDLSVESSVHAHGGSGPNRTPAPPWIFCRERFARIFLSCPTPVLSGRISLQPITKLPSFLLNTLPLC